MLQKKLRNLSTITQIQSCIMLIDGAKNQIKQKIGSQFIEIKNKLISSLEKAQKTFVAKINQSCISSIDMLTKVNDTELSDLEVERWLSQTDKFVARLKGLQVDRLLKGFYDEVKASVEQVRKCKIEDDLTPIAGGQDTMRVERVIKVEGEPVERILVVNKKLCQVTQNSVTIQKHTIQKQLDYILPIKLQNKNKQILFSLSNNTIGLYSDKLTLHSYRALPYNKADIVSVVQLGNYIFMAERYKLTRISLGNLNEIVVRIYNQEIVALGHHLYQGYLQLGFVDRLMLVDSHTLEEVMVWTVQGVPRRMYTIKDYLIVLFSNGMQLYRNMEEVQLATSIAALRILKAIQLGNSIMLVTAESHIYCLEPERNEDGRPNVKRINQSLTKIIKGVACEGYEIYCLGENGTKIYVHSL